MDDIQPIHAAWKLQSFSSCSISNAKHCLIHMALGTHSMAL